MSDPRLRVDEAVRRSAGGVSRRRFLRRFGDVAAGVAFGTAFLWRRPDLALANHPGNPCSGKHCYAGYCGSAGRCKSGQLNVKRRGYLRNYCVSDTSPHCWEAAGFRCCDCCSTDNNGENQCSLCSGLMWQCGCYARL